jgi:hypothetical protein
VRPLACFVVVMMTLAGPASAAERTKLAVVDLGDKGAGTALVQNLTDIITVTLGGLGVFDVLSRADMQQMVAFEQEKQMLGCASDTSCLAELGGALGVALLVTGSVGKVGQSYIVNLVLTDTRTVRILAREQREVAGLDKLTSEVQGGARFLVRGLLKDKQGDLILKVSENGADVEVDGKLVGVTPLGRQTLAGGPHTLRVSRTGFVAWARDVDISSEQPTVVEAALVPSVEFIEAYDARARTWRGGALVAGGLGVAGVLFGGFGYFYAGHLADDFNRDVDARDCRQGASSPQVDCETEFGARRRTISTWSMASAIAGGLGVVALGLGVYLFSEGPTPGIYDSYKVGSSTAVVVVPSLDGGGYAAVATHF